ncbi:MAG: Rieske 2Fe-2S domain-containing protein [Vicinamibacterales bacterium]
MSSHYRLVQWNRRKVVYDLVVVGGIAVFVTQFQAIGRAVLVGPQAISEQVLAMRAWGACAFLLLTVILCLGPLARLWPRVMLPLLYNRRHAGVIFFGVAVTHARHVLDYYHAYGPVSKLQSLWTYDAAFTSASLPFQWFGAGALLIFGAMAATSHDLWQHVLGAARWKRLHMGVYLGYALVVAHVAFGALQFETHPLLVGAVVASVVAVVATHLLSDRAGRPTSGASPVVSTGEGAWIDGGLAASLIPQRARRIRVARGEDIALVRDGDRISAIHGVCAHQGGPLAEGRVIDGCLTCPWHGWQYRPADGQSPPPFTERLATHRVRLDARGHVLIEATPQPAGTPCEPIVLEPSSTTRPTPAAADDEFFVGYLRMSLRTARVSLAVGVALAVAVLMLGTVLAVTQRNPGPDLRPSQAGVTASGLLELHPYPHLHTLGTDGRSDALLFSGSGKNAASVPADKDGTAVTVQGDRYERGRFALLEGPGGFAAASLDPADQQRLAALPLEDLGMVTVEGEIVDSKCYAGRMKPGVGHGHRACAQLCIAGGVPPVLVAFAPGGDSEHYLLATTDNGPVSEAVLPFVAEPVRVEGHLWRRGSVLTLQIDPARIHRL